MYLILWQYTVHLSRTDPFERTYGPQGEWAALFRRAEGYLGTSLFRQVGGDPTYVTVDRWKSAAAYDAFRTAWESDYRALDERSRTLSAREVRLGIIETGEDVWMG